jgi:hypothetical protein
MAQFAQWLSATPLSLAVQKYEWLTPLLQTIHILAIAMVLPSAFMIGLRTLGVAASQSVAAVAHRFVPWIWTGLALLTCSGIVLIIGEPQRALVNPAFQIKMLLVLLAAALTYGFQVSLQTGIVREQRQIGPMMIGFAVGALLLWCAIAFAGRLIAYTQPA